LDARSAISLDSGIGSLPARNARPVVVRWLAGGGLRTDPQGPGGAVAAAGESSRDQYAAGDAGVLANAAQGGLERPGEPDGPLRRRSPGRDPGGATVWLRRSVMELLRADRGDHLVNDGHCPGDVRRTLRATRANPRGLSPLGAGRARRGNGGGRA